MSRSFRSRRLPHALELASLETVEVVGLLYRVVSDHAAQKEHRDEDAMQYYRDLVGDDAGSRAVTATTEGRKRGRAKRDGKTRVG